MGYKLLFVNLPALYRRLNLLWQTLRLIRDGAGNLTLLWTGLLVMQGLLPVVTIYLTKLLVDSLVAAMDTGISRESIQPTLLLAGLMAGALLLAELLQSVNGWVYIAQSELMQDHVKKIIHQKSITVDLAFYETPDYYDRLYRAQTEANNKPLALLENAGNLLQNVITFLAMATILLPYGIWLPVALFISTLPAVYVVFYFNQQYHRWWEQTTSDRRRAQYYDIVLTHSVTAPELRLFGFGPYFQATYQALRQRLREERLRLAKAQNLARLGAGLFAGLIAGLVMIWMIWRAFQGVVTLGDLTLFYQTFNRGQGLLRSLLGNIGQIYSNTLFLGNLFEFLELKPQVVAPPRPLSPPAKLSKGVNFRQITFSYPGSQTPVLKDFNLTIPAEQIMAIVGPNGAGKSTLVKLLCRFYDPEKGCVELDGVDIRTLLPEELRRQITILFQFPVSYQTTAGQNIALGDLTAKPNPVYIEAAARGAGAHEFIMRLPQGYDTPIGKWFANGAELSGGEGQRLALARAFLRQAQIIILDEPTSFMDSWAEAEWLARFKSLVAGKTAIIITHRFTTAMQADIIHVMDRGQIIESGSHTDLLAQNGRYAQSWLAQMQAASPHLNETISSNGNVKRVE